MPGVSRRPLHNGRVPLYDGDGWGPKGMNRDEPFPFEVAARQWPPPPLPVDERGEPDERMGWPLHWASGWCGWMLYHVQPRLRALDIGLGATGQERCENGTGRTKGMRHGERATCS